MKALRNYSRDICVVTSERRSLHEVIFDEIEDVLGEDYNIIKIDKLTDCEIQQLDGLLDRYSLWTDLSASTDRLAYM